MSDDPEVPTDDARRFNSLLGRILRVSKDESWKRREAEYQKEREGKREEIRKRNPTTARP